MMNPPVIRHLYRCLVQLHPAEFRREFADEMLWIFDETSARGSTGALFTDALVSLARQWILRKPLEKLPASDAVPVSAGAGSFAWEHIALPETSLSASRVIQGSVVAIAFMTLLSFAAFRPAARRPIAQEASPGLGGTSRQEESPDSSFASSGVPAALEEGRKRAIENTSSAARYGDGRSLYEAITRGSNRDSHDASAALTASDEASLSTSHSSTAGQNEGQNTPATRQFKAWLEEFNTGDQVKFQAFLEKNYPDQAKRIDGMMGFRSMTGGFDFKKAEKTSDTSFVGIVKERDSDTFARFEIEVEAAEPHRITKLDLDVIPTPHEFAIPRMSEEQALVALRSEIERRVAADSFSGSVMVTKNGKVIFSGAYGMADREKKIKNELDTQFRIGSMNKMFTAVSVMQLVQSGKLNLKGTVGEYLPDYPNKDVASKVTIHHLLTHTGGTGDFFGPEFDKHRLELRTLQDYVKLYGQRGLEFEPGSKWDYSNYGFLLLGVIVQRVGGQDYYDYVRQHVCAPAGMTSTDSLPEDQAVPKRSVGYMRDGGSETWKPNIDTLPYRGTSAGGGYSTVEDLQRFADALQNHKLLNAQNTESLTTGKAETGGGAKYAYGFMDQVSGGVRSFGHGGGAPGMNGELTIYPQSGYVIAVLANMDPPAAQRIASFIGNRLPEK
jgi:CubicO group peptidase (beta-lactamase class C family)